MTSAFLIVIAASQATQGKAPLLINPLPPVRGKAEVRKGKSSRRSLEPLTIEEIPGAQAIFVKDLNSPGAAAPAGVQGPNFAFESALSRLFGPEPDALPKPQPKPAESAPPSPQPTQKADIPLPKAPPSPAKEVRPSLAGPISKGGETLPTLPAAVPPPRPKPEPEKTAAPTAPAIKVQDSPAGSDPGDKLVNVNVAELELSKILQILSEQSGANLILLSPSPKTLTIRLTKMPLRETLSHIAAVAGLRLLRVGAAFIIASPQELESAYPKEFGEAFPKPPAPVAPPAAAEPKMESQVLVLSYATASEIVTVLKHAFDEKELKAVVGPTQHIPSLSNADTEAVTGIQTGILRDENGRSGGGSQEAGSPNSRSVVLYGQKPALEAAVKLAKSLDVARPQVAIAVKIIDITNDSMKDLGMTWTFGDATISESDGTGFNFRRFDRDPQSFFAKITALQKADKAKIMAEPNISVLDNQRAFILIGQRLNFPTLVGYTQANTPIFAPKEERVGIYMQVAASISPSGEITMSLYPQVSTVTSFLEVNGASYPQISTREAQTTLRVKSGESIILGGLIRDEEIRNVQKVPLLADIPILGEFFRKVKTQKVSSQIIITITPIVTFPDGHAP